MWLCGVWGGWGEVGTGEQSRRLPRVRDVTADTRKLRE